MFENIIQEYKENKIKIENVIQKLSENVNNNDKKFNGVVYTPKSISDFIIKNIGYQPEKTILEPTVGHGIFIFSLIEYVEKTYSLKGEELKNWFESKVFCFDIDTKKIEEFKKLLEMFFNKRDIYNVDTKNISTGDTLFLEFKENFDFSVGNPPYIKVQNLDLNYLNKLRNKYKSCEVGNVDIYYAFMELMSKISTVSSFIVPNGYIINRSAKTLREIIKKDLIEVIDLKSEMIFKNVRVYTSIYKTNKNNKNEDMLFYKEKLNQEFKIFNKNDLDKKQWVLSMEEIKDKKGKSIIEDYNCYGSVATLKDSLYILKNIKKEDDYYIYEYQGKTYKIEKEICLDYYKVTKMNNSEEMKIIYPYKNNKIIPEEQIKINYPNAYIYLCDIKNELSKREKGNTGKYEAWYAYGRKQGINKKKEKYFLLIPLMSNKPYECEVLIEPDDFLITAGFVIGFYCVNDLYKIKSHLESDEFFNYVKQNGKVWSGKTPYYTFTKKHLQGYYIE